MIKIFLQNIRRFSLSGIAFVGKFLLTDLKDSFTRFLSFCYFLLFHCMYNLRKTYLSRTLWNVLVGMCVAHW